MKGNWGVTGSNGEPGLGFETISGFGQPIHATPHEPIDSDHSRRHHDGRGEKEIEVAAVGRLADRRSQAHGCVDVPFEMKVLGDDARVPGTAGSSHEASDEVGEYSGQDEFLPA